MLTWKTIQKKDLPYLQTHYRNYEHYSDFNSVSLWGYMVPNARISRVGDTLIYELLDYQTQETYYSVLGNKDARDALKLLLEDKKQDITLRHVPKTTFETLATWERVISHEEDHDNHDYIFKVNSMVNFSSGKFRKKRKYVTAIRRQHPNLKVVKIDHTKTENREAMYRLFKHWVHDRDAENWKIEYRAMQRTLLLKHANIICIGVYDHAKLIGYTINEREANGYYQGHYGKADYSYKGIGILLEHETAKFMKKHYGSTYLNLQQDLGIEGIRYYKSSLGPCKKLRKYSVVLSYQGSEVLHKITVAKARQLIAA